MIVEEQDYLEHYGIPGMRWGVRKEKEDLDWDSRFRKWERNKKIRKKYKDDPEKKKSKLKASKTRYKNEIKKNKDKAKKIFLEKSKKDETTKNYINLKRASNVAYTIGIGSRIVGSILKKKSVFVNDAGYAVRNEKMSDAADALRTAGKTAMAVGGIYNIGAGLSYKTGKMQKDKKKVKK